MDKKALAGKKVMEFVQNNMTIGLGTGSTVDYMIEEIGQLVRYGWKLRCVASSKATELHAIKLHIPLIPIDLVESIDLCIDGVDEIDERFYAIKGGGGALLREKMIAKMAKKVVWIMDDTKQKKLIGAFPLPIEIVRFGYVQTIRKLREKGYNPVLRMDKDVPFETDNGNYIIDLHLYPGFDVDEVEKTLDDIVGVVEHGLFINMCDAMVVGGEIEAKIIKNPNSEK